MIPKNKLLATTIIAIFMISTFAMVGSVNAHFTLGDLTGSYRFHKLDFDPHVPGVIGYVWPGGGQNAYQGVPNYAAVASAPGYQSPYPCRANGEQLGGGSIGTIATSQCNPAGAPTSSWYQLQGSAYAPFGAVLAGSTGDLIFAINSTSTRDSRGWGALMIAIPPEFNVPDVSQVTSTLSNNYNNIYVDKLSPWDRYAPGWTLITVFADSGCAAGKFQITCNSNSAQGTGYYNHQFINFTSEDEWYYVRINGMQAPWIAGRYFFKMLLYGDNDILGMAFRGENTTQFVPTQNWPVLLVKGEIDPGIITGTIRYGGYNSTLYGQPIGEAGMVLAKMQVRLDPYTGEQRPDLQTIDARGFFNATSNGHYEVEGVAPGIYDIYAEAAGFPQQLIESSVTILKGQSLHFDGYVQPGPVIHGNVYTKHQYGDEPWMGETLNANGQCIYQQGANTLGCYNEYIKIELYGGATLNHIPDASAGLVSWSPLPCVAGGQALFYDRRHAGLCGDPRLGSQIAFPWHEYSTVCAGTFPNIQNPVCPYGQGIQSASGLFHGAANGYVNDTSETYALGLHTSDPQGVGPPQNWFVQGGTTTPFHFEFGVKGEYGAPRDLSGMVPQVYSTWINGLTPGRYFVRAWVFRYVQAALDGSTFQEYYFDVTPQEWAGDVTLPIDLRLSSWINKTVHFHNQADSSIEDPIDTGGAFMSGYLVGADGHIYSYNQSALGFNSLGRPGYFTGYATGGGGGAWLLSTGVQATSSAKTNTCYGGDGAPANGIKYHNSFVGGSLSNQATCGTDLDKAKLNIIAINTGRANIQFWGINDTWSGENYGIPSGTYSALVFALGYLPQGPPEQVSVTLSGTPTSISDHLIRGVGFNVTLYSVDWQRPTVNRSWVWGNRVGISKSSYPNRATFGTAPCFGTAAVCPTSFKPFPNAPVGAEIDVGIYSNGTLAGYMSDESSGQNGQLPSTITTLSLFQDPIENNVTATGGGWDPVNALGQIFPQDSNSSYFGQELKRPGFLGGYGRGRFVFNTQTRLWTDSLWVVSPGGTPITPYGPPLFPNLYQTIPTAFRAGQYDLRGFTYGYIQDQPFSVFAGLTQTADIRLNLVIGVNVTLDILFKKEHVITPTAANMSGRVRLFDDSGNLIAEWMSSEGVYVPPNNVPLPSVNAPNGLATNGRAIAANGQNQFPFGTLHSVVPKPLPLNEYNFIPGGITLLHVLMSGLPQVPAVGVDAPDGNNNHLGNYFGDPILPYLTRQCSFEVDCYKNPGTSWSATGFFPNIGISGYPDYQGGWTAEVDFVNWYNNNSATPEAGNSYHGTYNALTNPAQTSSSCQPQPLGTCTIFNNFAQYYFPVNGLLEGESYHIIPGTTATSGISLTEDLALGPWGVGHSMAPNHLGPYSQEGVWQVSGTHLSGEASGIFELDLNGFVSGTALAFTWANDFRPLSWATVSVTGANGATWNYYTYDGQYDMFLIPGAYSFTITSPGIASQTLSIAVTGGESSTATNVYLQQSNIPVPEFSGIAVVAFSALAASLYVLQRRRRK